MPQVLVKPRSAKAKPPTPTQQQPQGGVVFSPDPSQPHSADDGHGGEAKAKKSPPQLKVNLTRATPEEEAIAFDKVDLNGNGKLSYTELEKGVESLWPHFNNKPAIMRSYKASDVNHSGLVSKREFHLFLLFIQVFDTAWQVYTQLDTNGDRRLSKDEFLLGRPVMSEYGIEIAKEDMEATFQLADADHGGCVLFEEFCALFASEAVKREKLGAGFKPILNTDDYNRKKHPSTPLTGSGGLSSPLTSRTGKNPKSPLTGTGGAKKMTSPNQRNPTLKQHLDKAASGSPSASRRDSTSTTATSTTATKLPPVRGQPAATARGPSKGPSTGRGRSNKDGNSGATGSGGGALPSLSSEGGKGGGVGSRTARRPGGGLGGNKKKMGEKQSQAYALKQQREEEDAKNAAAIRIQSWWKLKFYNKNFFLVIRKAAEFARQAEEEQRTKVRAAKAVLSKFFLGALHKFRAKTAAARRRRRIHGAEIVNRLLMARRSEIHVMAREKMRRTRAVLFIFDMWRKSKIFAKVRWRVADEQMRAMLETTEDLERRQILVQERLSFQQEILYPHHASDVYLAQREDALLEEIEKRARFEEESHREQMDEALYGAPGTSSVASIQRGLSGAPSDRYGSISPKFSLRPSAVDGSAIGRASTGRASTISPRSLGSVSHAGRHGSGATAGVSPTPRTVYAKGPSTFGSVRQVPKSAGGASFSQSVGFDMGAMSGRGSMSGSLMMPNASFFASNADALISPQKRTSFQAHRVVPGPTHHRSRIQPALGGSREDGRHASSRASTMLSMDSLFMCPRVSASPTQRGLEAQTPAYSQSSANHSEDGSGNKKKKKKNKKDEAGMDFKPGLSNMALGVEWAHWFLDANVEPPTVAEKEANDSDDEEAAAQLESAPLAKNMAHEFLVERGLIQEHRRRCRLEEQWLRLLLSILQREEEEHVNVDE